MKRAAHIHGGASSDPDHKDGTVKAARIELLMTCFKEEGRFALLAFSCFEGIFEFLKNQFWAKELRYTAIIVQK